MLDITRYFFLRHIDMLTPDYFALFAAATAPYAPCFCAQHITLLLAPLAVAMFIADASAPLCFSYAAYAVCCRYMLVTLYFDMLIFYADSATMPLHADAAIALRYVTF